MSPAVPPAVPVRWSRLAPALAFGVVLLAMTPLLRGSLQPEPGREVAPTPPLTAAEAGPWLEALAAVTPLDPAHPSWRPLADHPAVVEVWDEVLLAEAPSPGAAWALAVFGSDPAWLGLVAQGAGLPQDLAAVLLSPEASAALTGSCPGLSPPLGTLCTPRSRAVAEARLDASLASWLLAEDPYMALWSLEAACGLGPLRGARVADHLEGSGLPQGASDSTAHLAGPRAVLVRGCTLPEAEAVQYLVSVAELDDGRVLVAAAELGRLGDPAAAPALDALAQRLGRTGDAALARWARALSTGEAHTFAEGAPARGL